MAKNLVVLMDGTANQFGDNNTNIVKLLAVSRQDASQVVFYSAGIGTFGLRDVVFQWQHALPRILGLAFGWGVRRTLESAYRFLMDNYEPGDSIYVFGFSRGAYVARSLCAMLKGVGLIHAHLPNQFDYAFDLMKQVGKRPPGEAFPMLARFTNLYSRKVKVRFLGVFDTVKSVGWVYSPFSFPYTASNNIVQTVRHAVALDERRCFFRQNLWNVAEHKDAKEVWFPGVHCDVGGGYPEAESGLAKVALQWMCEEARKAGLAVEAGAFDRVVMGQGAHGRRPASAPDAAAPMHVSLKGPWWLVEPLPRRPRDAENGFKVRWEFPLFDWRHVGRLRRVSGTIMVHPAAVQRAQAGIGYAIPPVGTGFVTGC